LGSNNKYKEGKEGRGIGDVRPYISLIRKRVYRQRTKGFRPKDDVLIGEIINIIKDNLNVGINVEEIQENSFINSK